jgi:predicted AlkP superfamily phosphohydrolase/phosphomutase
MRALCLEYFRQLDGFIEFLVTAAGPGVQVFLASDHGFTATDEIVRINTYLHEKGYLDWLEVPNTDEGRRREDSMFAYLDWERTLAYCGTPSSNGITIRVARERGASGVAPAEYEALRERLIADLEDFRDPATGERIITAIHKREDVFAGAAMEDAPDLLLTLRDHGFVSIKNKAPAVEPRPTIAGTHHPDGVFIGYGPGITPGAILDRRNIVDVGATLLHSLGLPVPSDFEGRVPQELFTDEYHAVNPVVIGRPTQGQQADEGGVSMSDSEKDQIMAQLQMLGYVE